MATSKKNRVRLTTPWPYSVRGEEALALGPFKRYWNAFTPFTAWPQVADYNSVLGTYDEDGALQGLRFVEQPRLSRRQELEERRARQARGTTAAEEYVAAVVEKGCIGTRAENWHDFLNALTWVKWPRSKRQLYTRYYGEMQKQKMLRQEQGPGAYRRPEANDLLTCFDEGGLVVRVGAAHHTRAVAVIEGYDRQAKEELMREGLLEPVVFGHGLLENILVGKTDVTAMAVVLDAQADRLTDEALADYLSEPRPFTKGNAMGSFPVSCLFQA